MELRIKNYELRIRSTYTILISVISIRLRSGRRLCPPFDCAQDGVCGGKEKDSDTDSHGFTQIQAIFTTKGTKGTEF